MSEALYPYYERELIFIRQLAQDFARQYPAAAGRLMLEPNRSVDPHVERMIEAFALLSARIHHKLDDEFPELTHALLDVLYPHYLAPVPSMAIVQFQLDAARGELPDGFNIAKGSRLHTSRVGNLACKFRTGYPTTLWPIELKFARLQAAPFPAGFNPPPRTAAALRLQFECSSQLKLSDLSVDRLRLYLDGEAQVVAHLYELLFNHALRVDFRPLDGPKDATPISLTPQQTLHQVGFGVDEGLLPYPARSFIGYRLLSEFFAFPSKFLFLDLGGWKQARNARLMNKQVEVVIYLSRSGKIVEQGVEPSTFALGCAPVVNLFEQVAEPINVSQTRHEYRIVPDVAHPLGMEVYSVDSVVTADPTAGVSEEVVPFYSFRHGRPPEAQQAFWYSSRRSSRLEGDRGMDTYLTLVDHAFTPYAPADSTLVVRTTCTNRSLPNQLQMVGDSVRFELEAAAPLTRIRCLRSPTSPLHPPLRRGAHWGLVSHLNLNHLSITATRCNRSWGCTTSRTRPPASNRWPK
jgi:type VI secretion system protein ImpG